MEQYVTRRAEKDILKLASFFPIVSVVGPRQVGKTSLIKAIRNELTGASIYLDLEAPADLAKLENPNTLFDSFADHTIMLDEVQRVPQLFPILRGIIDRQRRPGRLFLLGSASPDLIRDTSETLAGRISYYELKPFFWAEVAHLVTPLALWFRGGFPDSLLAPNDDFSNLWRGSFVRTYLERDLAVLGLNVRNSVLLGRLWQMCAHISGDLVNVSKLAASLGISTQSTNTYLDFFEAAYLIRRLPPYFANLKKRLVKTPKLYVRDTGILHRLLAIETPAQLLGHPAVGASFETFVLEQIDAIKPDWAQLYFYRTSAGAEIDIVITRAGKPVIAVEVKHSETPKLSRGFYTALTDLEVDRAFVVAPVDQAYPISDRVNVLPIVEIASVFS